jgi:hypothetical protein
MLGSGVGVGVGVCVGVRSYLSSRPEARRCRSSRSGGISLRFPPSQNPSKNQMFLMVRSSKARVANGSLRREKLVLRVQKAGRSRREIINERGPLGKTHDQPLPFYELISNVPQGSPPFRQERRPTTQIINDPSAHSKPYQWHRHSRRCSCSCYVVFGWRWVSCLSVLALGVDCPQLSVIPTGGSTVYVEP